MGVTRAHGSARPRVDYAVYLVTDTELCGAFGVVATVGAAVEAGATVVQVRDPEASDRALVRLTRACVAEVAARGYAGRVPVILNDRPDLVVEAGADGAHVGQSDLDISVARALIGPTGLLGLSAHTEEEVAAAVHAHHRRVRDHRRRAADPGLLDYLGVGPLRSTTSKRDHAPVRGLAHLGALAAASPWPCVAIGGVTAADADDLAAHGLAGMAVVSAICGQPDVAVATRRLAQAWQATRTGVRR